MKYSRPAPTLNDVAKRSGFSTATVSRCLNFPERVSEQTRDKVNRAIDELGYSPNFGARVMASQRTYTIGAIIPTMDNAIFARGLQAFEEELHVHGYTMLVASSSYRADVEAQQVRSLVSRGADGLLLIGHHRDPATYRFLDAQQVPSLVTWAFDASVDRPSIGFDNHAAMRTMAQEVLRLGHRKLAMISAGTANNDRASARLAGIGAAMQEIGLPPESLVTIETNYGIENGAAAFEQLIRADDRPTAILCGNDVLAVGALGQAREVGIKVPEDVSIVGFDDIELAQVAYPKLTTVHVPHREMGRRAARALVDAVQGGLPVGSQELPTELRIRDTLRALPDPQAI